jgi:hypothetical protein
VVSRRVARPGRQQSWVRDGECAGHHRGLRAGQVVTGGTRERGRAIGRLDDIPGLGDRGTTGPGVILGASPQVTSPSGRPRTTGARKVSGRERQAKQPARDTVAVVASPSTGEGGEPRPKGPTGGQATSSRVSHGREPGARRGAHHPGHQHARGLRGVAEALLEEPSACMAPVRVCGGAGWVTIGSTRQVAGPEGGQILPVGVRHVGVSAVAARQMPGIQGPGMLSVADILMAPSH